MFTSFIINSQLKIINNIALNHILITNYVTKKQYNRQHNKILLDAMYYRNVDKKHILG